MMGKTLGGACLPVSVPMSQLDNRHRLTRDNDFPVCELVEASQVDIVLDAHISVSSQGAEIEYVQAL